MRTLDLAPLYRATVGYDQIADLMGRVMTAESGTQSFPPYNIEKTADESWLISIAVAGFGQDDLTVEQRENALFVSGKKADDTRPNATYLHKGIATRAFERRFHLADHVRVDAATVENGMLQIALTREIPERLKPRRIAIATAAKSLPLAVN